MFPMSTGIGVCLFGSAARLKIGTVPASLLGAIGKLFRRAETALSAALACNVAIPAAVGAVKTVGLPCP